jgi:hypothetical protein
MPAWRNLKKGHKGQSGRMQNELKINDIKVAHSKLKETVTDMINRQLKGVAVVVKQRARVV